MWKKIMDKYKENGILLVQKDMIECHETENFGEQFSHDPRGGDMHGQRIGAV